MPAETAPPSPRRAARDGPGAHAAIRCPRAVLRDFDAAIGLEWLETNGRGGYASSTVIGVNTRRYHGLLVAAPAGSTSRFVLLAKLDETLVVGGTRYDLATTEHPDGVRPGGFRFQTGFRLDPFPVFTFAVPGAVLEKSVCMAHGEDLTLVTYALRQAATAPVLLEVRPLVAGRDHHALRHGPVGDGPVPIEAPGALGVVPDRQGPVLWISHGPARAERGGSWCRAVRYRAEAARGYDCEEDLYSPGVLRFELPGPGAQAALVTATGHPRPAEAAAALLAAERARRARRLPATVRDPAEAALHMAAPHYLVERDGRTSVIAGYPWFGEWGRDTFIALRGICLAAGDVAGAGRILRSWAATVSEGLVPNCFPDGHAGPAYNAVDASLWFVVAVGEYLAAAGSVDPAERALLREAADAILAGYTAGTRYGIGADADGLLHAGAPGVPLTWMDAKVDDWVVTPRAGKPVEVQALWINALAVGAAWSDRWKAARQRAAAAFPGRFWNPARSCLYDVVDVDGRAGAVDDRLRPNQIFAVGGLPLMLLDAARAGQVVDRVEARLWTPLGLRSLAPGEPGYRPRYAGNVRERDAAYHQGTVWPWLLGPFVEAWLRVHGRTAATRAAARARFLAPVLRHVVAAAGLGHVSEVADGDPPHTPGGCPFQAWSVGEILRLLPIVDGRGDAGAGPAGEAACGSMP